MEVAMNNKKTDFYGKFEFNGKKYPFHYEDSFVTVIQEPWEYNKDFENESFVEKIVGLTSLFNDLWFDWMYDQLLTTVLGTPLVDLDYKEIYNNIIFSTQGFVLFGKDELPFDCIEFESEALNTFYPPIQLVDGKLLIDESTYKIKSTNDTTQIFDTTIDGEDIKMELAIPWKFNLRPEDKTIGEKYSVWRMRFEKLKFSEGIAKYYLYLHDFLVFLNFRKNISIDHFTLYRTENMTNSKIGIGKFFSYQTGYNSKVHNSIIFDELGHDNVSHLFSCIAMQRNQTGYNDSYIPKTQKDSIHLTG